MRNSQILVKLFNEGKQVDRRFVSRCPRFNDVKDDYVSIENQLRDERFNLRALNNLESII